MSYLRIGDQVVNLMAVSLADYYAGNIHESASLVLHIIGVPEPLTFIGDEADAVWSAFCKMGTSLEIANR